MMSARCVVIGAASRKRFTCLKGCWVCRWSSYLKLRDSQTRGWEWDKAVPLPHCINCQLSTDKMILLLNSAPLSFTHSLPLSYVYSSSLFFSLLLSLFLSTSLSLPLGLIFLFSQVEFSKFLTPQTLTNKRKCRELFQERVKEFLTQQSSESSSKHYHNAVRWD